MSISLFMIRILWFQGEFNWDTNTQGLVLGAFFYGYITTQIPGGWLAEVFGGKKLFGFGVLCTAVLTLLTPLAARWNLYVFIALRVVEGIGEVSVIVCIHVHDQGEGRLNCKLHLILMIFMDLELTLKCFKF